MKRLILASGSANRKTLLKSTGVRFSVEVSDYDEDMKLAMAPKELAIYLSQGKARTVAAKHKNAVILAADSFAVLDGQLLGKPHTVARAKEMLASLSGRQHTFITGFTIIDCASGREYSAAEESQVYFRKISPKEIATYLAKDDVLEKAAAYTPQGLGGTFIYRIEGDANSVAYGLPLSAVTVALKDFGVEII